MSTANRTGFIIGVLVVLISAPNFAQNALVRSRAQSRAAEPNKPTVAIDLGVDSRSPRHDQEQPQSRIDAQLLARAENRADALREQLVNLKMREIELQARVDEIDYRMKPESIQQTLLFVASVRPMDELRSNIRASLEKEKNRANAQLELIAATRVKLEAAIRDADAECERLRQRLRLTR